jgi:hypothetical protein
MERNWERIESRLAADRAVLLLSSVLVFALVLFGLALLRVTLAGGAELALKFSCERPMGTSEKGRREVAALLQLAHGWIGLTSVSPCGVGDADVGGATAKLEDDACSKLTEPPLIICAAVYSAFLRLENLGSYQSRIVSKISHIVIQFQRVQIVVVQNIEPFRTKLERDAFRYWNVLAHRCIEIPCPRAIKCISMGHPRGIWPKVRYTTIQAIAVGQASSWIRNCRRECADVVDVGACLANVFVELLISNGSGG